MNDETATYSLCLSGFSFSGMGILKQKKIYGE